MNLIELTNDIVIKKYIQSLIRVGLNVILLKYEVATQRSINVRLDTPTGSPLTTSLTIPAQKIRPYPKWSIFFNVQKNIKMYEKLNERYSIPK